MENDDVYARLKRKNVIVATHVYGTGASQDLVRFLNEHLTRKVMYIGHPLLYDVHLKGSGYERFEEGKKVYEYYTRNRRIPLFLGYAFHVIKSVIWIMKTREHWDLYVGSNNINAFVGILLRSFGLVRKVVYYVIDFNPVRYDSPMINSLYQRLDQYCVRHCDETWNLSPRMEEGRKKYFGFSGGNQRYVPVGLWIRESVSIPLAKIHPHRLAFVGHVQEKQGIQYVIRAMPELVKKFPDVSFIVIGGGEYVPSLKALVAELHLANYVKFTGFVKDHKDIERLVATSALGVALYSKYDGVHLSFSYFGNPTKVKTYFTAGLPVLMTDVPYNARDIVRAGCGQIVTVAPKDIAAGALGLMMDPKALQEFRNNVVSYRKQFDWNTIFRLNLARII